MPICLCKTGPKGLGPRCSKNAIEGSKYCTIHNKKCLGEFTQRMAQPVRVQQQRMVPVLVKQQRKAQPVRVQQQRMVPVLVKQQRKAQPVRVQQQRLVPVLVKQQRKVQKVKAVKKAVQPRGCVKQTLKKYLERPSPPFPANECKGQVMMGNNGKMWASVEKTNGVSAWKEIKQQKA